LASFGKISCPFGSPPLRLSLPPPRFGLFERFATTLAAHCIRQSAFFCFHCAVPPCLLFEDDHLLVVDKPAGLNTHAPSPYTGEGLYDWLRHREPRWGNLAIVHRLDKETSGIIIFSKTSLANRSLTEQFTERGVRKKYLLLTDRLPRKSDFCVKTCLVRAGEKYISRPLHPGGVIAETRFNAGGQTSLPDASRSYQVWAEPLTGKTHQIRVHAADQGFPILGDTLYGGTPASRVFLHAAELSFQHPATGKAIAFQSTANFEADPRLAIREALIDPQTTNAYRLIHGASDGRPGWHVDRLGDYLLSQSECPLGKSQTGELERITISFHLRGAYHKLLTRQMRTTSSTETSPELVLGEPAPPRFPILENGLRFHLSFEEGYSVGLFLDQRDNRRRLLTRHIGADFPLSRERSADSPVRAITRHTTRTGLSALQQHEAPQLSVLNAFAYTCGFSIATAKAGATTSSLDLSKKYLAWGKENLAQNDLEPAGHDFILGDVFDWLRRLAKKQRIFDVILLDPPTFSQSKESGVFRVERDYRRLVALALPLLRPGGILFTSTNAANWPPEHFIESVEQSVGESRRKILQRLFFPQPPDFPVSKQQPAYLKTLWLRLG
jgi:23S rRNA (cytosine1962-C5)-methyltransferase